MILVYVKPENEDCETCWELPIRSAKSQVHLMKRIHKMLKEEYKEIKYTITRMMTPFR